MNAAERAFHTVGSVVVSAATDIGGMTLVLSRSLKALLRLRLDRSEFVRALLAYGEASLPVVGATAAFVGMIMVIQGAVYVEHFGVRNLVGWYSGWATFREIGPLLVGLIFSGRVGASHASEMATMKVHEQLDALRVLAIDVYEFLVVPRFLGMVVALVSLVIFADLLAVFSGALCARVLLGIDYVGYFSSLIHGLAPRDVLVGLTKAACFGVVIAVVSTYFGMSAKEGSEGVGRAVNAQVVACALGMFCSDWLVTAIWL